jgi:hypothetical protein
MSSAAWPRIGAVARPGLECLRLPWDELDVDRHLDSFGKIGPGDDLDPAEIRILAEIRLQLEQLVTLIQLTAPERNPGLQELGIEDALVEGDRAKAKAGSGFEAQHEVRSRCLPVYQHHARVEIGVQEAAVGGHGEQRELAVLVGQVAEGVAAMHRKFGSELLEGGEVRSFTRQSEVEGAHDHRRPRIDAVAGHPALAVVGDRALDDRSVVAERLECRVDVVVGAPVQSLDAIARHVAGIGGAGDLQHRAHVSLDVAAHTLDFDTHRLRTPGLRAGGIYPRGVEPGRFDPLRRRLRLH